MSNPLYYPNRDMLASGFPTNWTLLKRLMWVRIMQGGSIPPAYETVTGNPVSFETVRPYKLRQLSAAFAPVQSLNGYDAPWPAGGGKNLFNKATITDNKWINDQGEEQPVTGYWLSDYISVIADETYFRPVTGSSRTAFYGSDKALVSYLTTQGSAITAPEGAAFIRFVGTGTTYNDNIQFEKGSSATSYAPYENECPISGWSSLTMEQRGKNLFDQSQLLQATGWALNEDGYYFGKRGAFNVAFNSGFLNLPKFKPNTQYTLLLNGYNDSELSGTDIGFKYTDGTKNEVRVGGTTPTDYSLTSSAGKTIDYIYGTFGSGVDVIVYLKNIMLVEGTTAAEYVPYNGRSISISLGSTVYSGWVDVISGVGEITWAIVDLGSLNWNTGFSGFYTEGIKNAVKIPTSYSTPTAICTQYAWGAASANNTFFIHMIYEGWLIVVDNRFTSPADFKTAVAGVKLVYELATPIPIQLTPQEVESLLGENVLFSDANGDLTVEYRSN